MYPNLVFARAVARIIDQEATDIAKNTDDPDSYYEEIGNRIVAAYKETKDGNEN